MQKGMFIINKWSDKFENSNTRKRQRLGWFLAPSGTDSKGYRQLMRQGSEGVKAYGVFMALCQYMATLPIEIRGQFANSDGSPMDIEDISEITRMELVDIQSSTEALVKCGWLTLMESTICQSSATYLPPICQSSASFVKGEGEGKGEGKGEGEAPKPPEGDRVTIFPKGSLSKPLRDQKKIKVLRNLKSMVRIGSWFGRNEKTLWTVAEANALKLVKPTPEEIETMEKYYQSGSDILRRDLQTLLNNWSGELDRANKGNTASKPATTRTCL